MLGAIIFQRFGQRVVLWQGDALFQGLLIRRRQSRDRHFRNEPGLGVFVPPYGHISPGDTQKVPRQAHEGQALVPPFQSKSPRRQFSRTAQKYQAPQGKSGGCGAMENLTGSLECSKPPVKKCEIKLSNYVENQNIRLLIPSFADMRQWLRRPSYRHPWPG